MIQKLIYSILFILMLLSVGLAPTGLLAQEGNTLKSNVKFKKDSVRMVPIQKNSEGTEFWVCFQRNFREPRIQSVSTSLQLELFVTSDFDSEIVVEIDGIGYKKRIKIPQGQIINIKIDPKAQILSEEIPERLTVHIVSDNPISVYGLNRRHQSTDTYLALPSNALGKEYRTMCYNVSDGLTSQFAVIGTEDRTTIRITPNALTTKRQKGRTFNIVLNKGDVYQVVAKAVPNSKCDLTGSLIKSDKNIAVFSGHQCTYVPDRVIACNHLVEQMPPVPAWGKHFYIGRLTRRTYYSFRILANEDSTKVFIDNRLVAVLNAGQHYENMAKKNIQVTASKPVLLAQYSQGFKNGDSVGDPMMLLISPTQQFLNQYRFATPVNGHWYHYVNLIVPTSSIRTVTIDGVRLDTSAFIPLGLSRYSIAFTQVGYGAHTIQGAEPFGMYSYGFGTDRDAFDAYGNMGGQSFVEYEPAADTLPPTYLVDYKNNKSKLIIRDDRVDDSGLRSVSVIESENLELDPAKIDIGMTQLGLAITPKSKGNPGRLVVQASDVNFNKSIFTICYALDRKSGRLIYQVNEGILEDCELDKGYQVGMFGKFTGNFHYADFQNSGNIETDSKFSEAFDFGGYFGFIGSMKVMPDMLVSLRLSMENYAGTITSANDPAQIRDPESGELVPFYARKELSVNGLYLNSSFAAEWYPMRFLYLLGGLNFSLNMSNSVSYYERILEPLDAYDIEKGSNYYQLEPSSLNSLNSLRVGVFGGVGFTYSFTYNISAFTEMGYNYYLSSMISDGDWKHNQFGVVFGVRYKI
jgi:IgGFc binding protein